MPQIIVHVRDIGRDQVLIDGGGLHWWTCKRCWTSLSRQQRDQHVLRERRWTDVGITFAHEAMLLLWRCRTRLAVVRIEMRVICMFTVTKDTALAMSLIVHRPVRHADPFCLWEMHRLLVPFPVVLLTEIGCAKCTLVNLRGFGRVANDGLLNLLSGL
jgi:hypothetical protein